jgi:hypothetical protein
MVKSEATIITVIALLLAVILTSVALQDESGNVIFFGCGGLAALGARELVERVAQKLRLATARFVPSDRDYPVYD